MMILINEMKRTTAQSWLFSGLLAAALLLVGCAKHEAPSASKVAPSPSPNSAKPTPTPATGDLVLAQEFLNLAAKEFYNRNNRGALEYIDMSRAELAAAVTKATDAVTKAADAKSKKAADKFKTNLETAAKDLDSVKTMIEKSDKKTDNSLTNLIEKIGKLANEQ
jgi:hypothetical protein